jgi:hypothetical protein
VLGTGEGEYTAVLLYWANMEPRQGLALFKETVGAIFHNRILIKSLF